jgi:hypothetical protein
VTQSCFAFQFGANLALVGNRKRIAVRRNVAFRSHHFDRRLLIGPFIDLCLSVPRTIVAW